MREVMSKCCYVVGRHLCRRHVTFREPERRYQREVPSIPRLMVRERELDQARRRVLLNRTQPMVVNVMEQRMLYNRVPRHEERHREWMAMERPEERNIGHDDTLRHTHRDRH